MVTHNASNEPTAAAGKILQGQGVGTASDFSTATYPSTAGSSGKILISDGTNIISSTPTYPNSASGTGTILRADGTNWVATTATYPTTTTVNQVLYSSAANVVSGLATANTAVLATDGSGVPSITATPTVTSITFGSGAALNDFEQGTYTPAMQGSGTAGTFTYDATKNGRYQRTGRLVTVEHQVSWSSVGTATGTLQLTSLPFTSSSVTSLTYQTVWNEFGRALATGGSTAPVCIKINNSTTANLSAYNNGTGSTAGVAVGVGGMQCTLTYEI